MAVSHVAYKRGLILLSFSWNAAYEAAPGSGLSRNSLDNELRRITSGVRERMEREHNWGPSTDEDDGTHIPGKTTVLLTGNAAALAAVANMQEGALFLQDDGTNLELFVYTSAAWVSITDDVHGSMANLTDDLCHTQYMLKDSAYDLSMTFNMNDQRLSTLAAAGVPLVADHPYDDSPHSVAAYTALANDSLNFDTVLDSGYLFNLYGLLSEGLTAKNFIVAMPTNIRAILTIVMFTSNNQETRWHLGSFPTIRYANVCFRRDALTLADMSYSILGVVSS